MNVRNARNARTMMPAALFAFAALAACSSSPESVDSTSEAFSFPIKAPPPKVYNPTPSPPAWPQASEPYCSSDPYCEVYADPDPTWVTRATSAELTALGCTQPYGLEDTAAQPFGASFAVCYDTSEVSNTFNLPTGLLGITCDACLPQLPAGQVYVYTGGPQGKPNCPGGCPKAGPPASTK